MKANEFNQGVLEGVTALIAAAGNEPLALASPSTESYEDASEGWPLWLQVLGITPVGIASLVGSETCGFCTYKNEFTETLPRISEPFSSSGGGSSSSSFGGGSSGGGGASRSY